MTQTLEPRGRSAEPSLDLSACHREPIHIPGAVQPHGVLLVLAEPSLTIVQASRSAAGLLGLEAEELIGKELGEALGPTVAEMVSNGLLTAGDVLEALQLTVAVRGETILLDGILHRSDGLVVLEIENPRPDGEAVPADGGIGRHYRLIQETVAKISRHESVERITAVVTDEVRAFTGFDRVMVYKFEDDGHGWVMAESRAGDMEPYLGLHYPATDIPEQARRLYETNWLRLIADVGYVPSPIVPAESPETGRPLDLSKSVLRSVSPVHLQYLKNMGVGASMSISLMQGDRLWGLIACHHRTAKFVPYAARAACVLFGTVLSAQIVAAEQSLRTEERIRKRVFLTTLLQDVSRRGSVTAGLLDDPEKLLGLAGATGAALSFAGDVSLIGQTPRPDRVERIVATLEARGVPDIYATDSVPSEWPEARRDAATACGLLAVRFPSGDYLVFFRPEVVRTVRWAGNPHHPASKAPIGAASPLSPRASFEEWAETVRDRSAPWDPAELQLAQELRNGLSVYILRREADLAKLNRQLAAKNEEMSQFLYTVSHDLKSPLITCRGFIGLLREDLADGRYDDLEDFARRVDDAAGHMGRLIDDLLELYRLGRSVRPPCPVQLRPVAEDLRQEYAARLTDRKADLVVADDLPEKVVADPVALKRVLDNLMTNALKYGCTGPDRTIALGGAVEAEETRLYLRDHGSGVPAPHREKIFQLFQRLAPPEIEGSGVGLASVAKVMRLHGGRAWVEDTPGGGATFWIAFPNEPQSWAAVGGPAASARHLAQEEES